MESFYLLIQSFSLLRVIDFILTPVLLFIGVYIVVLLWKINTALNIYIKKHKQEDGAKSDVS